MAYTVNKENKTISFEFYGEQQTVKFQRMEYMNNGNTAIQIVDCEDESPWAMMTVNLIQITSACTVYMDFNSTSVKEIVKALEKENLVIANGMELPSGWCTYPQYWLTDEFLNNWCEDCRGF